LLVRAIATLRRQRDASVDLATALVYLGQVRLERGDLSAADPLIREALDIRLGRFGRYHPMVANATDGLGELFEAGGQLASAEQAYRDALAIRRVVFPANHADVGVSLENVGIVLEKQGRNAEAEATLDSAIAILQPVFGDDHSLVTTARTHRDRAITVQALPVTSSNRTPADPASHR
jgi:Tfp pilus assembly protein PilF